VNRGSEVLRLCVLIVELNGFAAVVEGQPRLAVVKLIASKVVFGLTLSQRVCMWGLGPPGHAVRLRAREGKEAGQPSYIDSLQKHHTIQPPRGLLHRLRFRQRRPAALEIILLI
jgi:hypothetical protein